MPRAVFIFILFLHFSISNGSESGIEFFEKEIRPILVERCYQCHSVDKKIKGGLRLDSRAGIEAGGDSGAVIAKGDAEASLLIEAIRYHDRELQMPPKNRMPEAEIERLEKWVNMGAPDPREENGSAIEPTGMSLEDGRKFWSFVPIAKVDVPNTAEPVQSPVDAFILAGLQENGLKPAAKANKRVLIRRLTQNLTGLPPTAKEIDSFLTDDSDSAFSRLVERLLSSPHYGVRWGRHWLDVARYADSNGLDENLGFGQAWRYRDYVVNSFNDDKPFDQFLIEQIAGDLLPNASPATITGTGFLQLGPKVLAEPNRKKLDMDVIDEQLDTLGKAFLGMTFGCVRCHDHKFDPVSQADYYSLAAIFKGTKTMNFKERGIRDWYEHSLVTEEEEEKYKEIKKQIAANKKAASAFKNKEITRLRGEARSKAADYLVAATEFDTSTPLSIVKEIAAPLGLHPRILHHCRMHLAFHQDDEFFQPWHRLAASGKVEEIRKHYGEVFKEAEAAFSAARKKDAKTKTLKDERLEAARSVLFNYSGLLAVPTVDAFAFDKETLAEYHKLLDKHRSYEINAPDEPSLMSVCDGEVVAELPIHIRGSIENLGEKVSRNFPAVMRWSDTKFPQSSSGRLELSRWMTDSQHPLTARVMANRVWAWHFGEGLVKTTENFGVMGDRPSHPELLDWLAQYLIDSGWSIKALHRVILNSDTWQQASRHSAEAEYSLIDPENRLLWKAHLRRLEAEQIRDSILAVSGRLESALFGGKTLPLRNRQFVFNHTSEDHTKYHSLRRAIYLPVIRNHLYPMFEQFDYPDPTMPTGVRNETVIAPQALVMLNDSLIMDSSEALAYKITSIEKEDKARVKSIYHNALGREPTAKESERILEFVSSVSETSSEQKAWSLVSQSLLVSNEFIYIR